MRSIIFKILHKLWPEKIRNQLICGFAVVILLFMTCFVFELISRQRAFLRQQNLEQCRSLACTIAANSSSWVLANDVAGLEEIVLAVKQYPDLRYLMVVSPDGKVLAHTDKSLVGMYLSDPVSDTLLHADRKLQILVDDNNLLDLAAPVLSSTGDLIGWARIGQCGVEIAQNLDAIYRNGLWYTLLAIIAGSAVAFLIGSRLAAGLARLQHVSDQIKAGRRDLRIEISGNSEIARLGAGLNEMLDAITAGEERYRIVADNTCDWEFWVGPDGRFIYVSPACERITGRSVQEFMADPELRLRIAHPEDRAAYAAFLDKELPPGQFKSHQYRIIRPDGEVRWLEHMCRCISDNNGRCLGCRGSNRDITDRKLAEAAILHAEAYNRNLLEASLDPLITIGADGRITSVNGATENITGRTRQELAGTDFADCFTDPEKARSACRQALNGGMVHDLALELKHRSGKIYSVLYNASVYRDESGNGSGVFASVRDVTEICRMNEELEQRIQARTQELEHANLKLKTRTDELEAFNTAMTGREQRIIELKEEVNDLCARQNSPEPYPPVWKRE